MVDEFERTPLSRPGDAGSSAYPGTPPESGIAEPQDDSAAEESPPAPGWDPVAVAALVLAVLTLAVPAAILAIWAVIRSHGDVAHARRARIILVVALAEIVLGALLWTVYFVWLAPILTLPAG